MNIIQKYNKYKDIWLKELGFMNINPSEFYENENNINREIVRTLLGVDIDKTYGYKANIRIIRNTFKNYDININNFYYQANYGFVRIFYVYNGFIMDININKNIMSIVENIKELESDFNSYFIEGAEMPPFFFIRATNLFRPQMMEFIADYIREEDLINAIKDFQKSSDYNSNNFSLELMTKAFEGSVELINDFIIEDYVTLYRGVGSKSTPLDEAYSWTLNIDVAKFFATRAMGTEDNIDDIKVYKALVPKKYIIGVVVDSEEEVLINPNCIDEISIEEIAFNKAKLHEMPRERKYLTDKYLPIEPINEDDDEDDNGKIKISPLLLKMFGN